MRYPRAGLTDRDPPQKQKPELDRSRKASLPDLLRIDLLRDQRCDKIGFNAIRQNSESWPLSIVLREQTFVLDLTGEQWGKWVPSALHAVEQCHCRHAHLLSKAFPRRSISEGLRSSFQESNTQTWP
jgi:hypothetical protein